MYITICFNIKIETLIYTMRVSIFFEVPGGFEPYFSFVDNQEVIFSQSTFRPIFER